MKCIQQPIVLCLAGYKGYKTLELLPKKNIQQVITYGGYADAIESICKINNIPVSKDRDDVLQLCYERTFFVGWQYLFQPSHNFIVIHDSLLPKRRGFCPTVSAMLAEETTHGITAFKPDRDIDSGEVYQSRKYEIKYPIKIKDVFDDLCELYIDMIIELSGVSDEYPLVQQELSASTFSIWRDEVDYEIDWTNSAEYILRFINTVGYPFDGAKTWAPHEIRIRDANIIKMNFDDQELHCGKVWSLKHNKPIIVCGENALQLLDYGPTNITKLKTRLGCKR